MVALFKVDQLGVILNYDLGSERSAEKISVAAEVDLHLDYADHVISVEIEQFPELFEFCTAANFSIAIQIPSLPQTQVAAMTASFETLVIVVDLLFAERFNRPVSDRFQIVQFNVVRNCGRATKIKEAVNEAVNSQTQLAIASIE